MMISPRLAWSYCACTASSLVRERPASANLTLGVFRMCSTQSLPVKPVAPVCEQRRSTRAHHRWRRRCPFAWPWLRRGEESNAGRVRRQRARRPRIHSADAWTPRERFQSSLASSQTSAQLAPRSTDGVRRARRFARPKSRSFSSSQLQKHRLKRLRPPAPRSRRLPDTIDMAAREAASACSSLSRAMPRTSAGAARALATAAPSSSRPFVLAHRPALTARRPTAIVLMNMGGPEKACQAFSASQLTLAGRGHGRLPLACASLRQHRLTFQDCSTTAT